LPTPPRVPGITAALNYLLPMTQRPYNYMYAPPAGEAWQNCEYRESQVRIADARAMTAPPTLPVEGFALWDAPTSVRDFRDEETVRNRYYTEATELAKCVTGADQAYVFDHIVRRREAGRPRLDFGRKIDSTRPGAAGRVHNDYTETSARRRLSLLSLEPQPGSEVPRFAIINIWRCISGKVEDTPLAVCDARTIFADDLVVTDMRYPERTGEIYLVLASSQHRWAYFSEMSNDEALVFKQYDSQVSGMARFTPHSAFDLPDIPPDAPLRESIEIRCLVTFA